MILMKQCEKGNENQEDQKNTGTPETIPCEARVSEVNR